MTAKAPGPGLRYVALLQLLRTAEAVWNSSRIFFDRWDLSPSQFNVLNLLGDRPAGSTQSDLSRVLIMHRSNLTGLVDRLEARGLVRRREQDGDRRAWRVVLTPAGRRLLAGILPHYYAAADQVWGALPPARIRCLLDELDQLSRNADRLVVLPKPGSGPSTTRVLAAARGSRPRIPS